MKSLERILLQYLISTTKTRRHVAPKMLLPPYDIIFHQEASLSLLISLQYNTGRRFGVRNGSEGTESIHDSSVCLFSHQVQLLKVNQTMSPAITANVAPPPGVCEFSSASLALLFTFHTNDCHSDTANQYPLNFSVDIVLLSLLSNSTWAAQFLSGVIITLCRITQRTQRKVYWISPSDSHKVCYVIQKEKIKQILHMHTG